MAGQVIIDPGQVGVAGVEELGITVREHAIRIPLQVRGADLRPAAQVRGLHRGTAGGEDPPAFQQVTVDAADARPSARAHGAEGQCAHPVQVADQVRRADGPAPAR